MSKSKSKKKKKKVSENDQTKAIEYSLERFMNQRKKQKVFDNQFMLTVHKFNKFTCESCGKDSEFAHINIFEDPESGQKYIMIRKACSPACVERDSLFEMNEVDVKDVEDKGVYIHGFPY